MAITSASVQGAINAVDTAVTGSTSTSANTRKLDSISFVSGANANEIQAVVDPSIVIASNSTVITLGNTTTTAGNVFAYTELKGMRIANTATNAGNITVTVSGTGINALALPPGSFVVYGSSSANGIAISNATTITANGTNGDILICTMLVS